MKNILLIILFVVSSHVLAGNQEGKIKDILVRQSDGLHYFHMSGTAHDRPACAKGQSYWMIKDENSQAGKSQLSIILAAYMSNKTVRVTGYGACTRWGDGEDVNSIRLK